MYIGEQMNGCIKDKRKHGVHVQQIKFIRQCAEGMCFKTALRNSITFTMPQTCGNSNKSWDQAQKFIKKE